MNGVRADLETAKMDEGYWPYEIQDMAAKMSLMPHSARNAIPIEQWPGKSLKFTKLCTFDQFRHNPQLPRTRKLAARDKRIRYLIMYDLTHVLVQGINRDTRILRNTDFHPIQTHKDPTIMIGTENVSITQKFQTVPQFILPGIYPPANLNHAKRHPERTMWETSHGAAPVMVDDENSIVW